MVRHVVLDHALVQCPPESPVVVLNDLHKADDPGCFAYVALPTATILIAPTINDVETRIAQIDTMLYIAYSKQKGEHDQDSPHYGPIWCLTDESGNYENLTAQALLYEASIAHPENQELKHILELLESFVFCMDDRAPRQRG